MTRAEREAFLAEVHVGVLAIEDPGSGPLALPIWYLVEDGDVVISMSGTSKKAELLRAAGRATLTAQTEEAPYRYVSVEGPITIGPHERDVVELASRYLGPELGRWYADHNPTTPDSVIVRLTPQRWLTKDFGKVLS